MGEYCLYAGDGIGNVGLEERGEHGEGKNRVRRETGREGRYSGQANRQASKQDRQARRQRESTGYRERIARPRRSVG